MILVHETSFNILIHFLSEKRLEIKQNMILYNNYKKKNIKYFCIAYNYSITIEC